MLYMQADPEFCEVSLFTKGLRVIFTMTVCTRQKLLCCKCKQSEIWNSVKEVGEPYL